MAIPRIETHRLAVAALLLSSAVALAQEKPQQEMQTATAQDQAQGQAQAKRQGQPAADMQRMNVEELNDNIKRFADQRVAVRGEIEEYLGPGSFVLESGGLFDDEITVVVPQNAKGLDPIMLREDSDVVVSGTVRAMSKVDIEREFGWDLDPEIEAEFEGTQHVIVAERVTRDRG